MSKTTRSRGESKTRWIARVSSTTPRLGPRCPELVATVRIMTSRISAASSSSCSADSPRRSRGDAIESRCPMAGSRFHARSWTATDGSCRLPIHTFPSCSRTPVTMWKPGPVAGPRSRSWTSRPSSSYAWARMVRFGFGWSASGILVTALRRASGADPSRSTSAVDRAADRHPDQPVAAAADVVGVARQVGGRGGRAPPPAGRSASRRTTVRARDSATQTKDSSAARATPLAKARPVEDDRGGAVGVASHQPSGAGVLDEVVLPPARCRSAGRSR